MVRGSRRLSTHYLAPWAGKNNPMEGMFSKGDSLTLCGLGKVKGRDQPGAR